MSTIEHYLTAFERRETELPGAELGWLLDRRRAGLESFARRGFPTPRDEDWKYTRVAPLEKRTFEPLVGPRNGPREAPAPACEHLADLDCHRLVFVDGRLDPELSAVGDLPRGAAVMSLAQALAERPAALEPHLGAYTDLEGNAFAALNAAFVADGAYVALEPGVTLERPLLLQFLCTPAADGCVAQPRVLVVAGAGAGLDVIEHFSSVNGTAYFTNAVTELVLAEGARLGHYKLQQESEQALHIATLGARQAGASRLGVHSVSLGAQLARNDINVVLDGEEVACDLNGLYLARGRQHVDFHTRIDHARPRGTSRELFKGIVDGRARSVFTGRVRVHPKAVGTDAQQVNRNLLLSRNAEADSRPQLEIYADDVKCSHGATVGQLDEDMLFYLRSRGIDATAAAGLLIHGFASDVLERMELPSLRERLGERLLGWLPNAQALTEIVT